MNKNICFFCGSLSYGGAERVISILSEHFVKRGYQVELVLYYDRDIFYEIGRNIKITIIEKETGTKNLIKNATWLRRYMWRNSVCIVSFLAPFNILALVCHLGCRSKIVVADRNDPRKIPKSFVVRVLRNLLYNFADGVVVQTGQNKAYFGKRIQKKAAVIFNPVDVGENACKALGLNKRKEIVSAGRLTEQKNQMMLIDAFAKVQEKYPDYQLIIYGEGPLREKLTERIQELKLENSIKLPGSVKNLHGKILASNIFVLTSCFEGMPNALIEAMCLGLPVISTKVSGATDLIENHRNGLLVDVGNETELVETLETLIGNETLQERIAYEATELNDMLSSEKIAQEWIYYVNKICG